MSDFVDEVLSGRGRKFRQLVSKALARRSVRNAFVRGLRAAADEVMRVDLSQTSGTEIARRILALQDTKPRGRK